MPLFIVENEHLNDVFFKHLLKIVEGDGELGLEETNAGPAGETWQRVVYKDGQTDCSGFSHGRLKHIVNHTSRDIVIRGVDADFHIQTGDQEPLTAFGGGNITDVAINKHGGVGFLFNGHDLEIVYDVTECNGDNYFAFRDTGDKIPYPAFIILFHHLAYARRIDQTDDASPPIEDVIQDENSFRNQFQCTLLRSIANLEVGCGFDPGSTLACPGENFNECQSTSCFIASAAFGSPRAPQVDKFRAIRDLILRQTILGDSFWQHLFAEYYQFSPQVAAEMDVLPPLRNAISKLVVEPLLDFYELMERYVRGGWQQAGFGDQIEQVVQEFAAGLPGAGFQPAEAETVNAEISRFQEYLGRPAASGSAPPPARPDVVSTLGYLAQAVAGQAHGVTYVTWALITPLKLYWQAVASFVAAPAQGADFAGLLREQMTGWLSGIPFHSTYKELKAEVVLADLNLLAGTVFSDPVVRRNIARRLLDHYGPQMPYDLEAVLREADYL